MVVKNLIETKVYLTPEQKQFLDEIIRTAKILDPEVKLSQSDVIRSFVVRRSNKDENMKSRLVFKAISVIDAGLFANLVAPGGKED